VPAPKLIARGEQAAFLQLNLWTPKQAAEWSGIKYRTLLRLLREGVVPCIPVGAAQAQKMRDRKRRLRACRTFLIPRVAFIRWFENIGAPDPSTIGSTAA
jgi:hypothetical protein